MLSGFDIAAIAVAALAIFIIFAGVKTVPQGFNYTVERFQKYTRTLHPGLTIIVPFIDQIGRKMNMMEQVLEIPRQDVISRDNAIVQVDGVAFFQVIDAAQASYEVTNLERAILALTMTNIRSVLGSMDLDHMLSQRDEINTRLLHVVDAAASPWGVKVTRIEIKDITPPSDIVTAMGRQMKAEREKRAAILVAEGAKQAQILEAEGRKEAAFRDAEARERSAQAEATATTLVSEAVAAGDTAALNYFVAQQYVEALKAMAASPNQKTFVLPYEATALLGSIGGIAELARDAFGAAADERRASQPSGRRGSVPSSGSVPPTV
ncbi:SPFH domain-containing protein [Methylopila turkensis]|uniref:Membrane protein n=1 Tax=Methylopila turkensis TaxID=1437816 RepID=A0A9W6N7E1_9HYPH|nr:SPFH domain-containing protein [Methylopila turkensis]GLK80443.1 membrane protein [Methylopila turkensis]